MVQFASGLMPSAGQGGIAVWAHVGGFIAGLVLVKLFAMPSRVASYRAYHWQPRRVGW